MGVCVETREVITYLQTHYPGKDINLVIIENGPNGYWFWDAQQGRHIRRCESQILHDLGSAKEAIAYTKAMITVRVSYKDVFVFPK